MEGQILGNRYLLVEKIGGGGMAVVYKAKCTLLNRFVAIKILRSEFTNDDEFVKRFKVEAQSVASLSHPNVVSIYDVGHQDDVHYIVMEYVDGNTLKDYITKHGALNWQEAIKITIQICSAIEHAHKNNIVHRDIKPHNILLTKDGIAKVTDFGIARAVTSSTITMVGSTIGSVHYFSPEQARGGFIDEKSDLYSLGIALYEMVAGRVPFDGDTPVSVALKHIQEKPIEPQKIVSSIPSGVNEIIMKAIQKDQNIRYQSATAMLIDLNKVLAQPQGGFVAQANADNQATIRMKAVNSPPPQSTQRINIASVEREDMVKQKKKNTTTYWLAGITCVLLIAIAIAISISLFGKSTADEYIMEDYIGKNFETVKSELETKGFTITEIWKKNETYPKGIIIDQSVPKGTVYRDGKYTTLELTISEGQDLVSIPDLKGKEYREARTELEGMNLVVKVEKEHSKELPANFVIRTEPGADEKVKSGSTVTLYVSMGEKINTTKIPNLLGRTKIEAEKLLAANKLKLGNVFPEGMTDGVINKQIPSANTDAIEGDSVTIYLETPPEITPTPTPTPDKGNGDNNGEKNNGNGNSGNQGGDKETGTKPDDTTSTEPQKKPEAGN